MNTLESLFPAEPTYKGHWQAIYLEPIVGSGEQIAIAVAATGGKSDCRIIQAIRSELLDCLYGSQASNMQSMIDWAIDSARKEIILNGNLNKWTSPFGGVKTSNIHEAADENIEGILRQAVRFTASLSTLALDAERDEDEYQPKRYSEQWARSIASELKQINPHLAANFKQKVKVSESKILTSYGFLTENYVTNFGLLVPTRLSSSLSTVKAKLFDLEIFRKSSLLIKPEIYEIIIGTPSLDDPTLSDKSLKRLQENIEMISELAATEGIELYRAENASQAATHINKRAA
ncbi:MAG: hypothetical protein ACJA1Z_000585 [Patiriisocius sp.]|jgi:hypothetical protein